MELTLQLKLLPTDAQAIALRATMARFHEACHWLAAQAFAHQCTNKLTLQRLFYHALRTQFDLSSQMAVRCLARVAGTYRRDKTICPTFRPDAAMPYDQRIMRFDGVDQVSLLTLQGRILVSFLIGPYHQQRFDAHEPRQCHLVMRGDGQWFLLVVVQVPDGTPMPPTDFLGVDLGVIHLATTSDGTTQSGDDVEACRTRYAKRRQRLQRAAHVAQMDGKRPKNIRRALKRTARREAGFRKDTNHCFSKTLVAVAQGTARGIALEDLQDIRARTRFRQPQRARMTGWAFAQLRFFVEYKAQLSGVPVVLVDPRHTSQECSVCGHIAKANRQSQARFSCKRCRYTTSADYNAALNIRARARVNAPLVAGRLSKQLLLGLAAPATSSCQTAS
ncbi:MAG TPA: transposase [Candidatus Tectomicrobia bacterium]